MNEHPLVQFAEGPAGRRPRIVGTGMDVWEVIVTIRDNDGDIEETARYLEMPVDLVHAAVAFYGAYPTQIDEWIELNERETEQAHQGWLAGQVASK